MLVLAKSWCFDDDADDDLPSAAAGNCISPDKTEIFVATLKVKTWLQDSFEFFSFHIPSIDWEYGSAVSKGCFLNKITVKSQGDR